MLLLTHSMGLHIYNATLNHFIEHGFFSEHQLLFCTSELNIPVDLVCVFSMSSDDLPFFAVPLLLSVYPVTATLLGVSSGDKIEMNAGRFLSFIGKFTSSKSSGITCDNVLGTLALLLKKKHKKQVTVMKRNTRQKEEGQFHD